MFGTLTQNGRTISRVVILAFAVAAIMAAVFAWVTPPEQERRPPALTSQSRRPH